MISIVSTRSGVRSCVRARWSIRSIEECVEKTAWLLDHPAEAEKIGRAAGELAVTPYDWRVVVQAVLRVYELAIAGAGLTGA